MRITRGGHGKTPNLGIFERVSVVTAQSSRRIKDFDGVNGQRLKRGESNARAKQIVWVRRDSEATTLVNHLTDFQGRLAFEKRQSRTDTEQVPFGRRHLNGGNNEKVIDGGAIDPHQAVIQKISDRVTSVVVGNGDPL